MIWAVRALNSLQKSIAFRPRDPRTGPIGGAGDAWPAGHMNLTAQVLERGDERVEGRDLFRGLLLCLFVLT